MANAPAQQKPRWGVSSFFQQAVANVESRLDTILANEVDEAEAGAAAVADAQRNGKRLSSDQPADQLARSSANSPVAAATAAAAAASSSSSSSDSARSSRPATRANDQLQERLARAVVRQSVRTASSPPRSSADSGASGNVDGQHAAEDGGQEGKNKDKVDGDDDDDNDDDNHEENDIPDLDEHDTAAADSSFQDYKAAFERLQADHVAAEKNWQDDLHAYIERIDALHSKLHYLANEAAHSARTAVAAAEPDTPERRLREKDEQIVALLSEGHHLSKTDLEHRTTIKQLRQYIADNTKSNADARRRTDQLQAALSRMTDRAKQAEAASRRANGRLATLSSTQKELDTTIADRTALRATLTELRGQLAAATARADAAERHAAAESAAAERRKAVELEDDLASARVERELAEQKLRRELAAQADTLERERERARTAEAERRRDVGALEAKLEGLRTRAEEVSSSGAGDAHANLLRQVEVLQAQYSAASENWQGIESALMARVAGIERERNEAVAQEAELRKKLRETTLTSKRTAADLESARESASDTQRALDAASANATRFSHRLTDVEAELAAVRADLARHRDLVDATVAQRIEEERARWERDAAAAGAPRTSSPASVRKRLSMLDDVAPAELLMQRMRGASPARESASRQASHSSVDRIRNDSPVSLVRHGLDNSISPPELVLEPEAEVEPDVDAVSSPPASDAVPDRDHDVDPDAPPSPPLQSTTTTPSSLKLDTNAATATAAAADTPPHHPHAPSSATLTSILSPSPSRPHSRSHAGGPGTRPLSRRSVSRSVSHRHRLSNHAPAGSRAVSPSPPASTTQTQTQTPTATSGGPGPSLQLIARLSATVRRLEAERAAVREEVVVLTSQRDGARGELVALTREVEGPIGREVAQKRAAEARVVELEARVAELEGRYGAALEMMGEKSEKVEELKADVEDLKGIYRELVDSTMK